MTPQKWGVIFNYIFPKTLLIRLAVKARGSEVQKTMAKYTKRRDKRGYY